MKNWKTRALALCLVLGCALSFPLGVTAATEAGIYLIDLAVTDGYDVTVQDADGNAVSAVTADLDGDGSEDTGYKDAEKLELQFAGIGAYQYVVFLLSDGAEVPTESSIRYIDQKSGAAEMDFTLYPDQMRKEGDYAIYLADTGAYQQVASFTVVLAGETEDILGDADGDGEITVLDAVAVLQYCADMAPEAFVASAADTSKNGTIGVEDAVRILEYCADLIPEF